MRFPKAIKVGVLFLAVSLFSAHTVWAENPWLLRYRLQPGQTLNYRIERKSQGDISVGSTREPVALESVSRVSVRILAVDPTGSAVIEATYAEPQNKIRINSQLIPQPAAVSSSPAVSTVRGRVSSSGRFTPESSSSFQGYSMVADLFPELPSVPVRPGFSWSEQSEQRAPVESSGPDLVLNVVKKYTYLGPAACRGVNCLKIGFESRSLLPERQKAVSPARFANQGRGAFYLAGGRLVAAEQESTTEVEYIIPSPDNGQAVKMTSRGTAASRVYLLP